MPTAVVLLLLGASLVALLLVMFARREAAAEREAAHREATEIREDARLVMSEAQRREERAVLREKELSADHRTAREYARGVEERVSVVARDERRLAEDRAGFEAERVRELEEISALSADQARALLMAKLVAEASQDAAQQIRGAERRARETAERRSREILVEVMQREVGPSTNQGAVTWIELPSEEMKGRIIGREGRNIRAFEALTGVNVIVEEGTNVVLLSSFDVERRETAAVALAALVDDGRIQPHRVELEYAKAVAGARSRHTAAGLDALAMVGVKGLSQELIDVLGRLRLRTSYGQNILAHLVESASLAANLARELGADVDIACRAALLHDIGKLYSGEREGTHAQIGAELAKQQGEDLAVVHAIAAHHDEIPARTVEAVIVQIADAVSAARPGARREELEGYLDRMTNLESLVAEHAGVARAFAMSAGREVRVIVEPTEVSDTEAATLARTIADHISTDFNVPGEVKVTVIREFRANAVAGES